MLNMQELRIKMCNFAKKYSSHERYLLNNSYLCIVTEGPSQSLLRKRLAFSILGTSTTLRKRWKGKDVLPIVMTVMDYVQIRHTWV